MQTEDNIFFLSQKYLAHGTTASVQCPEVDGVNAILIQFGVDPAISAAYGWRCSEALCVCMLHVALSKKAEEL